MTVIYGPASVVANWGNTGNTDRIAYYSVSVSSVYKGIMTGQFYSPGPNGTQTLDNIYFSMRAHPPLVGDNYIRGYSMTYTPNSAASPINLKKTTASVTYTTIATGTGYPPTTIALASAYNTIFNVGSLDSAADISLYVYCSSEAFSYHDSTGTPVVDSTYNTTTCNGGSRVRDFDFYVDNFQIDSVVAPPPNSYIIETIKDSSGSVVANGTEFDLYLFAGASSLDAAPIFTMSAVSSATGTDSATYSGGGLVYQDLGSPSLSSSTYILRTRPPASVVFASVETILTTQITPVVPT